MLLLLGLNACDQAVKEPEADTAVDTGADTAADSPADSVRDTEETADPDTADTAVADPVCTTPLNAPEPSACPERAAFTPSTGDIEPRPFLTLSSGTLLATEDLDGDGFDETLVRTDDCDLCVARPDFSARTATLERVRAELAVVDEALGNGQLLTADGELLALTSDGAGAWITSIVALASPPRDAARLGDLDGDGATDVLLVFEDALVVVRGPLDPTLPDERVLLRVEPAADYLDAVTVASADVDCDGADDLLMGNRVHGRVEIVYGPVPVGTTGEFAALAGAAFPFDPGARDAPSSKLVVVDDLDGDGTREIVQGGTVFDGVVAGYGALAPEDLLEDFLVFTAAPGAAPALVGSGLSAVDWWFTLPAPDAQWADAGLTGGGTKRLGRFGSPWRIDVAFLTEDGDLSWVLATGEVGADRDRDGTAEPDDCDDDDAAVHPDAREVADGADHDCDGTTDAAGPGTLDATLVIAGEVRQGQATYGYVWDGVAVWADNSVEDLVTADLSTGDLHHIDVNAGDYIDLAVVGDFDGDGWEDVGGTFWFSKMVYGPASAPTVLGSNDGVAWAMITRAGDLDGDGAEERVASGYDWHGYSVEAQLVWGDPARAERPERTSLGELTYASATGPADLDGDGAGDLLVKNVRGPGFRLGPLFPGETLPEEDGTFETDSRSVHVAAGDLDGDGHDDLVITAPSEEVAHVLRGPWTGGDHSIEREAVAELTVGEDGSCAIEETFMVPEAWLLWADPDLDFRRGAVFGIPAAALSGALTLDDATLRVDGPHPYASFGDSLTDAADVDADGVIELIVGAPWEDAPLTDEGTIRVFDLPE